MKKAKAMKALKALKAPATTASALWRPLIGQGVPTNVQMETIGEWQFGYCGNDWYIGRRGRWWHRLNGHWSLAPSA